MVICHGFKGFKDWGMFPWVADELATRGFRVVTFNFGGSGIGAIPDQFTELDRFRRNTLSLEVEELERVLDALEGGALSGDALPVAIGLLGHSRGGVVASVVAARRPEVRGLAVWAGVGVLDRRYPESVRRDWRSRGLLDIVNARTGQEMPIGIEALDDLEEHLEDYSPHLVVPALRTPTLWIHGAADATIPVEEARVVDERSRQRGAEWRFEVVAEADHTFGAVHPFRGPTSALEVALDRTHRFFREAFGGNDGGG